jgi:hypothetical protein
MDRTAILKQANEYITKDRQATHGAPEANFKIISELWSAYLNYQIKSTDVAMMMALLKVARYRNNPSHADNAIDLAGYAAIAGELGALNESSETRTGAQVHE